MVLVSHHNVWTVIDALIVERKVTDFSLSKLASLILKVAFKSVEILRLENFLLPVSGHDRSTTFLVSCGHDHEVLTFKRASIHRT